MEELVSAIQPALLNLVTVCVTCLFGYIGVKVKQTYTQHIDTDTKKKVVDSTVNYIEQVYTDVHGADKFELAKDKVVSVLNEKGINISEEEIEMLIESAVYGLNKGWLIEEAKDDTETTSNEQQS